MHFILPLSQAVEDALIKSAVKMAHVHVPLGQWHGLHIIAIGPKGGKIVGYGAGLKPIYAGSKESLTLAALQQANEEEHPEFKDETGPTYLVGKWLTELGVQHKVIGDMVRVHADAGEFIQKQYKATPTVSGSFWNFKLKDLKPFVGKPFVPAPEEHTGWAASIASGDSEHDPFPPLHTLKEVSAGKYAGSHGNKLFTSPDGKKWIFKSADPTIARAEEAASRIGRLVMGDKVAPAKVVEIDGETGVLVGEVGGDPIGEEGNHSSVPLSVMQKFGPQIVQHQVVDWLTSNHDGHAGNFLVDGEDLNGIDKGQAWKFFGKDELDKDYSPNHSKPIYTKFWNAIADGSLAWTPELQQAMASALDKAETISPEQYKLIVAPYVATLAGVKGSDWNAKGHLHKLTSRLETLRSDFQKYVSGLVGHKVEFPKSGATEGTAGVPKQEEKPKLVIENPDVPAAPPVPEKAAPVPEKKAAGWPKTKGSVTIHHPGNTPDPGQSWPKGYPGPGFIAAVQYKGKTYSVKFFAKDGVMKVSVLYPNDAYVVFDSPNQASDSLYLFEKGLPLTMTATEKKKAGISYPATKAFGIKAFEAELASAKDGGAPSPSTMPPAELEKQKIVPEGAKKVSAHDVLSKMPTGVLSDTSVLPPEIQDVVKAVQPVLAGSSYAGMPPPGTVVLVHDDGPVLLLSKVGPLGTGFYECWKSVGNDWVHTSYPKGSAQSIYGVADIPTVKALIPAEKVVPGKSNWAWFKEHPEEGKAAMAAAPVGSSLTIPNNKNVFFEKKADGSWYSAYGSPFTAEELLKLQNDYELHSPSKGDVGEAPKAELPPEAVVPPTAPKASAGPVPVGTSFKVKKKGLGEVNLHVLDSGKFEVTILEKGLSSTFASLSAASDYVWVNQQGYASADAYKQATGKTKIPSGGGWKFWGINPAAQAAPVSIPEKSAATSEVESYKVTSEAALLQDFQPGDQIEFAMGKGVTQIATRTADSNGWVWKVQGGEEVSVDNSSLFTILKMQNTKITKVSKVQDTASATPTAEEHDAWEEFIPGHSQHVNATQGFLEAAPTGASLLVTTDGALKIYTKGWSGKWYDEHQGSDSASLAASAKVGSNVQAVSPGAVYNPINELVEDLPSGQLLSLTEKPPDSAFLQAAAPGTSLILYSDTGAEAFKKLDSSTWEAANGHVLLTGAMYAHVASSDAASIQVPEKAEKMPEGETEGVPAEPISSLTHLIAKDLTTAWFQAQLPGTKLTIKSDYGKVTYQRTATGWQSDPTNPVVSSQDMAEWLHDADFSGQDVYAEPAAPSSALPAGEPVEVGDTTISTQKDKLDDLPKGTVLTSPTGTKWTQGDHHLWYKAGSTTPTLSMDVAADVIKNGYHGIYVVQKPAPGQGVGSVPEYKDGGTVTGQSHSEMEEWLSNLPVGAVVVDPDNESAGATYLKVGPDQWQYGHVGSEHLVAGVLAYEKWKAAIPEGATPAKQESTAAATKPQKAASVLVTAEGISTGVEAKLSKFFETSMQWATAGVPGKEMGAKPSGWDSWVPPPGVALTGQYEGKTYYLVTSTSGHAPDGDPFDKVGLALLEEDGVGHPGGLVNGSAALASLKEAAKKVGLPTDGAVLKKMFHLDETDFPPGSSIKTVKAGTEPPTLSEAEAANPFATMLTSVTKHVSILEALKVNPALKQHGSVVIKAAKKPGHWNIMLKGSENAKQDALLAVAKEYGFADKIINSYGKPKLMYGSWVMTVPVEALSPLVDVQVDPVTAATLGTASDEKPQVKAKPKKAIKAAPLDPELQAKIEKAKVVAAWAKDMPPVASSATQHILSHFQSYANGQLGEVKFWAREKDGALYLGSEHVGLHDLMQGLGLAGETVDTPLGTFYKVSPEALASALPGSPAGTIEGPDGKKYPKGTTFQKEQKTTPVEELLPLEPGFHKIGEHKTDPTMKVLKVSGTGDEQKAQFKAIVDKYKLAVTPAEPIKGSGNWIGFVPASELAKPGKVEELITPSIPQQPPPFVAASLPSFGSTKPGMEGPNNRADLSLLPSMVLDKFGHAIRMGKAGIFKHGQVYARKVRDAKGAEFFEVHGELLHPFDPSNSLLTHGDVSLYSAMTKPSSNGYGTKMHNFEDGVHVEGTVTTATDTGYRGKIHNAQVQVFAGQEAFKNMFTVRIPVSDNLESSLQESFLAMGLDPSQAMAEQTTDDERLIRKYALLKNAIGPAAWQKPSTELPPEKMQNEAWLDSKLAEHGISPDAAATARFETTFGDHQSVVYDDPALEKADHLKFLYMGGSYEGILYQILEKAGWGSRTHRMFNGIYQGGASSEADIEAGGANSVFMRIGSTKTESSNWGYKCGGWKAVFHPRLLQRTDWRFYDGDSYGRTNSLASDARDRAWVMDPAHELDVNNEICFEAGVSVRDLAGVLAPSEEQKEQLIKDLNKNGITELNGISLDKLIQVESSHGRAAAAKKFVGLKSGVLP